MSRFLATLGIGGSSSTTSAGGGAGIDCTESSINKCANARDLVAGCVASLDILDSTPPPPPPHGGGENNGVVVVVETTTKKGGEASSSSSLPPPPPPVVEQAESALTWRLSRMKQLLYECKDATAAAAASSTTSSSPSMTNEPTNTSSFSYCLVMALTQHHPQFLPRIIRCLNVMPFEARKDVVSIFNVLVTTSTSISAGAFGEYVDVHYEEIMGPIVDAVSSKDAEGNPDTALLCGSMYRSTLRNHGLYTRLLGPGPCNCNGPSTTGGSTTSGADGAGGIVSESSSSTPLSGEEEVAAAGGGQHTHMSVDDEPPSSSSSPTCAELYLYPLLDRSVFLPNFDITSDALSTVRDVFTQDRAIAAEFLDREYDVVIPKYDAMLTSDNYITKRMSLKLLGEILLDRSSFHVMIRYISDRKHLRIVMLLLRDPSGNIQFEAFHVFKIFVANPNKPPEIIKILAQNKVKLVAYLDQFHCDKEEGDEQFRDEKTLLINTLNGLEE